MSYEEPVYARPLGVTAEGPREEYRPKMPYRRGEESPFARQVPLPQTEQKGITEKTEIVSSNPEQNGQVDETKIASPKPDVDSPSGSPYTEGAYTDRIIAAVRDGYQTTTDIVNVTGIPRKAVIRTVGRLVIKGRLRNLPAPAGLPKGDRCVGLCSQSAGPGGSLPPIARLQSLGNERDHILASFMAIREHLEALKRQIDALFDALPDLRGTLEALEEARKSQEILASIVKTVRSLDSE